MAFEGEDHVVEQCLLGAAFIDPDSARHVVEELAEDDFEDARNAAVWRAMKFLSVPGRSVDIVSVHEHLKDTDEAAMVGGLAYLAGLDVYLPALDTVPALIRRTKERSVRRQMEDAVRDVLLNGAHIEDAIRSLRESAERLEGELPTTVTATLACADAEEIIFPAEGERQAISTGLMDLDAKIRGFEPGQLWTVAGRPSMGKSALAMHMGLSAAQSGKRVYFATLEMTRREVVQRLVSSLSGVDHDEVRRGVYHHGNDKRVRDAVHELDGVGFWICDDSHGTAQQIINSAAKHKASFGVDLLVVDYVQLLSPDGNMERREQEIADATRRLKIAANELQCTVILLSQLNRQVEYRKNGRPMLADLRESGAVEQNSDGVILIWQPEGERPDVLELLVAKNRGGSTGPVKVYFRRRILRFENLTQVEERY